MLQLFAVSHLNVEALQTFPELQDPGVHLATQVGEAPLVSQYSVAPQAGLHDAALQALVAESQVNPDGQPYELPEEDEPPSVEAAALHSGTHTPETQACDAGQLLFVEQPQNLFDFVPPSAVVIVAPLVQVVVVCVVHLSGVVQLWMQILNVG